MDYKNDAYEEQVASYDMSNVSIITFNELLNMLRLEMLCLETQDNALRVTRWQRWRTQCLHYVHWTCSLPLQLPLDPLYYKQGFEGRRVDVPRDANGPKCASRANRRRLRAFSP